MKIFSSDFFVKNKTKSSGLRQPFNMLRPVVYAGIIANMMLFSGCIKQEPDRQECQPESQYGKNDNQKFIDRYNGLSARTRCELQEARAASEKYKDLSNAIKDGYADISVILPNMGYHFMKTAFVDSVFEAGKPEILVYNKAHDGSFELVAVEYAVPLNLLPNKAPEGFTGSGDVWEYNTGFGLWLLHAWVWRFNPAGVFTPTNPEVHVHIQ